MEEVQRLLYKLFGWEKKTKATVLVKIPSKKYGHLATEEEIKAVNKVRGMLFSEVKEKKVGFSSMQIREGGFVTLEFLGKNTDQMLEVVLPILRKDSITKGWEVEIRDGPDGEVSQIVSI